MQLLHGIKASIDLCVWSENIYFPDLLDSTTIQLDLSRVVVCTCNPSHSYTSQHQQLRTNIAIYNPGHSNFFLSLQRVHRSGNVIIRSYNGGSSVVGLERGIYAFSNILVLHFNAHTWSIFSLLFRFHLFWVTYWILHFLVLFPLLHAGRNHSTKNAVT